MWWPRRERPGWQWLSIATHSIITKAWRLASMHTASTMKRAHVSVDANSSAALPCEGTSYSTKSTVIRIRGDINTAIPATTLLYSWRKLPFIANPGPIPAPNGSWILHHSFKP